MNVLVLGASGMLGHTLFAHLVSTNRYSVCGTVRKVDSLSPFMPEELCQHLVSGVDVDNFDSIIKVVGEFKPDCIINCVGIIKQQAAATEYIPALMINSILPHRLAALCKAIGARLVQISTDCVFDGKTGMYSEDNTSNAADLYGRTKYLGEVTQSHCLTLRTSIIGHELSSRYGLVEWFLSQAGTVNGFTRAIFSGFPTIELAAIIADKVLPDTELSGLYQVSSDPVSKYDLLGLIARQYGITTPIHACESFAADRSLDSTRFKEATGYTSPGWPQLVERMYADFMSSWHYRERHQHV
ncbi:MAG: SDR family oxidoreductase [Trichlorobacter sp.]|uniref:dTDP-4-dehydrorhamnose reductase family protein n=1 Tax=Trichlorobacter sp. TaxID=2911007 RepID=UPI00256D442F|nr:SDR family oxidoreductase [Trichlorobacter sp.]MDK9718445.1 SDR family oxidoreductase [Trichlorobacter sp.]